MNIKSLVLAVAVVLVPNTMFAKAASKTSSLVDYVNTLQGTNSNFGLSHGNTFPATAMPFAQHMWTPQTGPNGEGFKYLYATDEIRGFGQSHQCSPWVSDYSVYTFFPETGDLVVDPDKRGAKFSHDNETGKPHYYSVKFNNGVQTEFAPTERGVHFRFSYPKTGDSWLIIDGYNGDSEIEIDPAARQVRGWVHNHRFCNHGENFYNYFIIQFDQPFADYGTWENRHNKTFAKENKGKGDGYGAYLKFKKGAKVQAKAASSYISLDQARLNLKRELGKDKSIEQTKQRGRETWEKLLSRIVVEGGTDEQMRTFYSCLFRSNLFSRKFYEIREDGTPYYYSPYDGKIYDGYMFTDNGFWDTFRSQFPLTNILHPTQQGHYMNALLAAQKQCGWLPSWSFPGETGGMCGNHAISLLADAWAKGIRNFNPDSALVAYAHEAMNKGPWGGANGRAGWKEYFEIGYVPFPMSHGSVTQTLEYCYDDWCAYQLAKSCGNKFYERVFAKQMYNYKNLWDGNIGFFRGRDADGSWTEPFSLLTDDESIGMEGQCIIRKGDWYYLLYSARGCCGPGSDYEVRVARSKKITEPFQKYNDNPILMCSDDFQACGHGTVTPTPDGRLYYLCHSYQRDAKFYMGRQPILQELMFGSDQWPHFMTGRLATSRQPMPFDGIKQGEWKQFADHFASNKLGVSWTWNYTFCDVKAELNGNGKLLLSGNGIKESNAAALCQRTPDTDYSFAVNVLNNGQSMRGIVLYGDAANYVALVLRGKKLQTISRCNGKETIISEIPMKRRSIRLQADVKDSRTLSFMYDDGDGMKKLEPFSIDTSHTTPWDRVARPGVISAVLANSKEKPAEFSDFEMWKNSTKTF